MSLSRRLHLVVLIILLSAADGTSALQSRTARDREIAAQFAPVFYQALGDKPRSDYITNFDFDGDWRGDNNWDHADDPRFPLRAYVYYAVAETSSHYFVHYAVFHPRDYKGGERKGAILSELIREGARRGGKFDPTGLADETALAHENDLEGCLVVASKHGSELGKARVVFVETLHHNEFSSYVTSAESAGFSTVSLSGNSPLLYIEPKGHGIQALSEKQNAPNNFLVYKFAGRADDPEKIRQGDVGYDLLPIQSTLWAKAVAAKKINDLTYGSVNNYRTITINVVTNGGTKKRNVPVGSIGATFLGKVGGLNMARPPWGWFDRKNREQPLGQWFFDPATVTKRNFKLGESFSTVYTVAPFWARAGK